MSVSSDSSSACTSRQHVWRRGSLCFKVHSYGLIWTSVSESCSAELVSRHHCLPWTHRSRQLGLGSRLCKMQATGNPGNVGFPSASLPQLELDSPEGQSGQHTSTVGRTLCSASWQPRSPLQS